MGYDQNALRGVTGEASSGITPDRLRRLLASDPPVGAEVAEACGYDEVVLADRCGCSLRQLQRLFDEAGHTPHEWLGVHRLLGELQVIEHLDATGRLESIKRVAIELGYRHPGHFDRVFKKVFGLSPEDFLAERERALQLLGISLSECRTGRRSYPLIDI